MALFHLFLLFKIIVSFAALTSGIVTKNEHFLINKMLNSKSGSAYCFKYINCVLEVFLWRERVMKMNDSQA